MDDEYIGAIKLFTGNFEPRGYKFCAGQILQIGAFQALFAVIGNTYGGDGRVNFALPDLRGRVPVGQGQSPGASNYRLGANGGNEQITLTLNNLPPHIHPAHLSVSASNANQSTPATDSTIASPGTSSGRDFTSTLGFSTSDPNTVLNAKSVQTDIVGGGQPVNNLQPYLAVNYIICVDGIYPSRG